MVFGVSYMASLLSHDLNPACFGDHILDVFNNANGFACFRLL